MDKKFEKIKEFCTEKYEPGEYIYVDAVRRNTGSSQNEAAAAMDRLADEGLVSPLVCCVCPDCSRPFGSFYDSISEMPDCMFCDWCDSYIENPGQHTLTVYKRKLQKELQLQR